MNEREKIINAKLELLSNELVPESGKCSTLKGELVRATQRMIYRHWNDGDLCDRGYGLETVWSSWQFIIDYSSKEVSELAVKIGSHKSDEDYDEKLYDMAEKLVKEINNGVYDNQSLLDDSRFYKEDSRPIEEYDDEEEYYEYDD